MAKRYTAIVQGGRNTRYQAGATPYLGRTFTGWISPASWRTIGCHHKSSTGA
jgi:hypothetical protein